MRRKIAVSMMTALAVGCGGGDSTAPTSTSPSATGAAPHSGQTSGGMPVTIGGSNFVTGATVTFAGVAATNVVVTPTSITAMTPAHAAGTVDVVVKNPDGQTGTIAQGFIYADFMGTWSGTTSQAQAMSFTVDSTNGMTKLTYAFVVQGSNCTSPGSSITSFSPGYDVSGGGFVHSVPNDSTTGSLNSTTNASGTFKVTTPQGCVGTAVGTWTATKH
jgi:hypothetical protein